MRRLTLLTTLLVGVLLTSSLLTLCISAWFGVFALASSLR